MAVDTTGLTEVPMQLKAKTGYRGSYWVDGSNVPIFKTCSMCTETLPAGSFGKNRQAKYGLRARCKQCDRDSARASHYRASSDGITPTGILRNREKRNRLRNRTSAEIDNDSQRVNPEGLKRCYLCGASKDLREFHTDRGNPDGLRYDCKTCSAATSYDRNHQILPTGETVVIRRKRQGVEKYKARTPAQVIDCRERLRPDGLKKCTKCQEKKEFNQFSPKPSEADGLSMYCKQCRRRSDRARRSRAWERYWRSHGIPLECYVCEEPYEEADHVVPVALGGPDEVCNLLPICMKCNRGRDGKFMEPLTKWLRRTRPERYTQVLTKVLSYNVWPFHFPTDLVDPGDDVSRLLM